MAHALPSKSWQELQLMYEVYGAKLIELERLQKVFHFDDDEVLSCTVFTMDGQKQIVKEAFQRDVDETDGMLILLDAEINRRNKLVNVI